MNDCSYVLEKIWIAVHIIHGDVSEFIRQYLREQQMAMSSDMAQCCVYGRTEAFMKKTYKIEVDCANCANKMEEAAKKTEGVKDAVVNFMALKMKVEFEEGAEPSEVMPVVLKNCKRVEDDCEIFF